MNEVIKNIYKNIIYTGIDGTLAILQRDRGYHSKVGQRVLYITETFYTGMSNE